MITAQAIFRAFSKALRHIGCDCLVTSDRDEILEGDGAVLPGVGSFGDTVDTLNHFGIKETAVEFIKSGKPFLGICLGLQLLFPESEESPEAKGLGVLRAASQKSRTAKAEDPAYGLEQPRYQKAAGCLKALKATPIFILFTPII